MEPLIRLLSPSAWLSLPQTIVTTALTTLSHLKTTAAWSVFQKKYKEPERNLGAWALGGTITVLTLSSIFWCYLRKAPSGVSVSNASPGRLAPTITDNPVVEQGSKDHPVTLKKDAESSRCPPSNLPTPSSSVPAENEHKSLLGDDDPEKGSLIPSTFSPRGNVSARIAASPLLSLTTIPFSSSYMLSTSETLFSAMPKEPTSPPSDNPDDLQVTLQEKNDPKIVIVPHQEERGATDLEKIPSEIPEKVEKTNRSTESPLEVPSSDVQPVEAQPQFSSSSMMLPFPIVSSNSATGKVVTSASSKTKENSKSAAVPNKGSVTSKSPSKLSAVTLHQLGRLHEILRAKNYYFIKGPLIEAIQLYVEELRAACQTDISNSESYLSKQPQTRLIVGGIHPNDEISLCMKATRCRVGYYLQYHSFDEVHRSLGEGKAFENPIFLLNALIRCQPKAKQPASKKFIEGRVERLSKLLEVLNLVDELRRTQAGMDLLSEHHECEISLQNSVELTETILKWYKILIHDLNPDYTLWTLGISASQEKKQVRDLCLSLQNNFRASEHQFMEWKSKGETWENLEAIRNRLCDYVNLIQNLNPNDPCRIAFTGHLAISNSATNLLQAQSQIINAMRFDSGVRWLAEGGEADLDNAFEGVLCLSELLTILTKLPNFKVNPDSFSDLESEVVSQLESVSQILIKHWHNNLAAITARQRIAKMQQERATATTSDAMEFSIALRNLTDPIVAFMETTSLFSKIKTLKTLNSQKPAGVEDTIDSKFLPINRSILMFVLQAADELRRVASALESIPSFSLEDSLDAPPVSAEREEASLETKPLPSPRKPKKKRTKKKAAPPIPSSPQQAVPILPQEEPPFLPRAQKIAEVREKSKKHNRPEKLPLPAHKEVPTVLEAVDMPSFRRCIESVAGISSTKKSSSSVSDSHPNSSSEHLSSNDVKIIKKIMGYCERNKYSTQTRKERNVIAILEQNGYKLLPRSGGSHQRWMHPLLPNKRIILSTKSGGDLVHHRTIKELEEQLEMLKDRKKGESSCSSSAGNLVE